MKSIRCNRCGRLLGKIDCDNLFHVKIGKDGPQLFVEIAEKMESRVMMVCPSVVYAPGGKVCCGERTMIDAELIKC